MSMLFFFNDTATTEIYTLSLHDALPISGGAQGNGSSGLIGFAFPPALSADGRFIAFVSLATSLVAGDTNGRSEEHTSQLQSLAYLVCRLLLEKKINRIDLRHSTKTLMSS